VGQNIATLVVVGMKNPKLCCNPSFFLFPLWVFFQLPFPLKNQRVPYVNRISKEENVRSWKSDLQGLQKDYYILPVHEVR